MAHYVGDLWWVRLGLQRGLAAIYLVAFASTLAQCKALLGERGLLPLRDLVRATRFLETPSIFHLRSSDGFVRAVAACGVVLSLVALAGLSEAGPLWLSVLVWLTLWALYLSIVSVGQDFYAFGWESMLLEAGFFASFLGPSSMAVSVIPVLLLRWVLFRVELGAGLIKLRHDRCWRELTCLYFHYETQPLPNPLSWYFHHLPRWMHRASVLVSHVVQLAAPFGLLAPQPFASIAGGLLVFHQLWLIVSGNYSWLNWLTVVLGISALSIPAAPLVALHARPEGYDAGALVLLGVVVALSIRPALNLASKHQAMNRSYNVLHLVNAYGAFGTVTRKRFEVVLEGTDAEDPRSESARWREYPCRAKPGDVARTPPIVAPYHLRLDWLLWFLPFGAQAYGGRVVTLGYELWFLRLVERLLEADRPVLRLLRADPFEGRAPRFVRARYYRYEFTSWQERRTTKAWWRRTLLGDYLPPTSLADVRRRLQATAPGGAQPGTDPAAAGSQAPERQRAGG
ncbi:MAG TPA: lipase maturation factor family protein [Polyangiaceae bacterium]